MAMRLKLIAAVALHPDIAGCLCFPQAAGHVHLQPAKARPATEDPQPQDHKEERKAEAQACCHQPPPVLCNVVFDSSASAQLLYVLRSSPQAIADMRVGETSPHHCNPQALLLACTVCLLVLLLECVGGAAHET